MTAVNLQVAKEKGRYQEVSLTRMVLWLLN
jgi:hypothetical protein